MIFGIIKPKLRITLKHDREVIWQKLPMSDTKAVLQSVMGRQVVSQMLYREKEIEGSQGSIFTYLPKPGTDIRTMSRSSGDRTFIVINDRPVLMKELAKVLRQYYNNCHDSDASRNPMCYVCVKLPAETVDVNVDPNKTKVFLQSMKEVSTCLEEILLEVYGLLDGVPSWHYSDAPKKTQNQHQPPENNNVSDNQLVKVLLERNRETGRFDRLPCTVTSANHPEASSVTSDQLATKDLDLDKDQSKTDTTSSNALPGFSLTFHSSKNMNGNGASHSDNDQNSAYPGKHNSHQGHESEGGLSQSSDIQMPDFFTDLLNEDIPDLSQSQQLSEHKSAADENRNSPQTAGSLIHEGPPATTSGTTNSNVAVTSSLSGQEHSIDLTNVVENDSSLCKAANDGDSWSRGSCIQDNSGRTVQPVQLLAPSANRLPGKRPLSPTTSSNMETPPAKRKQSSVEELPQNQSTLPDFLNNKKSEKPMTPFELFCKVKGREYREEYPNEDEEDILRKLKDAWDELSDEDKMPYKDRYWKEIKRQEKQNLIKSVKTTIPKKTMPNVRAEVASMASQSQAEKKQKMLRKRMYHCEKKIACSIEELKAAKGDAELERRLSTQPTVIGQAESCDAWFCTYNHKLSLVNVSRLEERVLYQRLLQTHKLSTPPCDVPVCLDHKNVDETLWPTLQSLAKKGNTGDTYFHIRDERLVSNGFNIECRYDIDGILKAEVVGMCTTVPAYCVSDLCEIIQCIQQKPLATLEDVRPTKVAYYLQGEAVRMTRSSLKKQREEVQALLDQLQGDFDAIQCLHYKPIFHHLFDLSELLLNVP